MSNPIFNLKCPHLDLHGETLATLDYIVTTFLNDNFKMGNRYVYLIHGWNSTIIRDQVHKLLKQNRNVVSYRLDVNNIGQTIIELKVN